MEQEKFSVANHAGNMRIMNETVTDVVQGKSMGKHEHAMFENIGVNEIFVSPDRNAAPLAWLGSGDSKTLDGYSDRFIYLSCAAGLTSQIRITVW